jgi:hypothetical protein
MVLNKSMLMTPVSLWLEGWEHILHFKLHLDAVSMETVVR